jgi:hypothetical protein
VAPGASAGILTAPSVAPSGGRDFAFEFTGLDPTYSSASASVNDVLRLTTATPFSANLDATNTINLYFNVDGFQDGQNYTDGFFTDAQSNLVTQISNATYNSYVKDATGPISYTGQTYGAIGGGLSVVVSTINQTASFSGGSVSGQVMQFEVVPEPAAGALSAVVAVGLAGGCLRSRRRAQRGIAE